MLVIIRPAIILVLMILFTNFTQGQTELNARKSLYFELGGSGGVGSINFEQLFLSKKLFDLTWRSGLSFAPVDKNNGTGIVLPVMINCITGKNSHKLELGVGQGITVTTKGSFFALTTVAVGCRYQPEAKKWFFRITYSPLISYLVDFQIQQWAGISIGYKFKSAAK